MTLADVAARIPNAIVDGPFGSNLKLTDYTTCGVPVLQGKNITNNEFRWFDIRYISEEKASALKRSRVAVGDILIVKIGSIGYSAVIRDIPGSATAIIPANLAKVTPNPSVVDTQYLHKWLTSPVATRYLAGAASKTAQPALSLSKIKQLPIPLPPLTEQRRIAEVLDRAEALQAKRRAAIAHLDTLIHSIFLEMFGDPIANPKGWLEGRHLGDVADIVSGITKGRKLNGAATREVPYLAVVNVQDQRLDLTMVKTIEATEAEVERYRLLEGDLVLTEGGDPDKLGRGALWAEEIPECIHQNHIFRVRLVDPDLTPVYLNWLVGSQRGKRYFLKSAKQTTGIATINSQQLRAFPLLIPPVSLQKEFATAIDRVAVLREQMKASLQSLDACFASLQYRAFRGEL